MASQSLLERLNPKGYLEIIKRYNDGTSEVVMSDHNVITVGMGQTLAEMFSITDFAKSIENFSIAYFQVGTGSATMASSLTGLTTPLTVANYGETELDIHTHKRAGSASNMAFARINPAYINKSSETKVTFSLVLDENTANGKDIKEIGLFSKNPFAHSDEVSYMVAYRSFAALSKGEGFSLIFRWTLQF